MMNRRKFLKMAAESSGLAVLIAPLGCKKDSFIKRGYLSYQEHPVDNVFRDYDGYRVYFTDGNNVVREREYRSDLVWSVKRPKDVPEDVKKRFLYFEKDLSNEVFVIKNLEEGQRGFARVITYLPKARKRLETYTEIYIPKSQKISPGKDITPGKFPKEIPMHEIN